MTKEENTIKMHIASILSKYEHYWDYREDKKYEIVKDVFKKLKTLNLIKYGRNKFSR